ncbi:MAG TPA: aminotransferase class I and II [Chloroflexi bacterium]|nr:aminotransferase class I and II [Chloroflexota bacterium]
MRTVTASRYIAPLREGGSLPAVVEADDGALYVMKFVGAGQGPKALIAELIAGEIGRALGLNVPELVFMELSPLLARTERHEEILDLLRASVGLNLGMRFLPGAFAYNPLLQPPPPADLASTIVWFDAFVTNVDRTDRNVNLLLWQQALWLIDHGAALYFHHDWATYHERARSPFPHIAHHTLLQLASELEAADAHAHRLLDAARLAAIVAETPDVWLALDAAFGNPAKLRAAYVAYLTERLENSAIFVEEALRARRVFV